MKKILFPLLTLFISAAIFSACSDDDNDWSSDVPNIVEGTWKRYDTYPNVLTTFEKDFTSRIETYTADNDLKESLSQGKYKISADSVLYYQEGFVNKFVMVDDSLWITYGYNTKDNKKTYKYVRYEVAP